MQKSSLKYPVEFVDDVFGDNSVLADIIGDSRVLIVADMNVVQRTQSLGTRIGAYLKAHRISLAGQPVVMTGGERIKADGFQSALRVASAAVSSGLGSSDFVLALGGGTLLDVAGWVAAQVRGGVRLIRVPTTPASMMGAAFAEYASLDTPSVKDAFRLSISPSAVIINERFAETVLDGVWRAGLGEAVRLAVDKDVKMLSTLSTLAERYGKRDFDTLEKVVEMSVNLRRKKGGTELGLSSAAELEPKSAWKLPHGYAVAIGVLIDVYYDVKAGKRPQEELDECKKILDTCGALDGARHSKHILPPELSDFW